MLGIIAPGITISQNNNRISIQTGLFHSFFDGSSIVNKERQASSKFNFRDPHNYFGGYLNDSWGIQFQRKINSKSSISAEYMVLNASYDYKEVYNNPTAKPVICTRQLKYFNINYIRQLKLSNQFDFVYGGGLNYIWGSESTYHYTDWAGWGGEPRFYTHYRNDVGLNLRTGIEYSPLKWLTLYTNFDFIGIAYSDAKDIDRKNASKFYKENHGIKNIPSRYDLSWRFGLGFNF